MGPLRPRPERGPSAAASNTTARVRERRAASGFGARRAPRRPARPPPRQAPRPLLRTAQRRTASQRRTLVLPVLERGAGGSRNGIRAVVAPGGGRQHTGAGRSGATAGLTFCHAQCTSFQDDRTGGAGQAATSSDQGMAFLVGRPRNATHLPRQHWHHGNKLPQGHSPSSSHSFYRRRSPRPEPRTASRPLRFHWGPPSSQSGRGRRRKTHQSRTMRERARTRQPQRTSTTPA